MKKGGRQDRQGVERSLRSLWVKNKSRMFDVGAGQWGVEHTDRAVEE